jgi:hypothetical protein
MREARGGAVGAALLLGGCRGEPSSAPLSAAADPVPFAVTTAAPPADGDAARALDDPAVQFPDATALWRGAIVRTCGPNAGVCHNNKQFPDLQSVAGFFATVNQRCNLIRDDPATIDNLCEPPGDSLVMGAFRTRIGHVSSPRGPDTVVVTVRDKIPPDARGAVAVERATPGISKVVLPIPGRALAEVSRDRSAVVLRTDVLRENPVDGLAAFLLPSDPKPGSHDHVEVGDPNGDGMFGADLGGALVKPGDPMKSYLFLRALAPLALGPGQELTNEIATPAEEAQMPIANFQYWDQQHALEALWCWISGLKPDASNAAAPIDYARCELSKVPRAVAQEEKEASFAYVYSRILQPKCIGPCHLQGTDAVTDLHMYDDPQKTWALLVGTLPDAGGGAQTALPLIARGDPPRSYLFLKVTQAHPAKGERMPLKEPLPKDDVDAIERWIRQGANAY